MIALGNPANLVKTFTAVKLHTLATVNNNEIFGKCSEIHDLVAC